MASAAPPFKLESLQAGRGVAAVIVVVSHAAIAARDFGAPFTGQSILELGYLGVDWFFVLSGFIIYHSTVGRGRTALEYAGARFRRVYIPYLPVGVAIAAIYSLRPPATDLAWTWITSLTLMPVDRPALTVAWTLQHEILFYAIFGFGYFTNRLWLVLSIWMILILGGIVMGATGILFSSLNLEFFFGIAAAKLYRRRLGDSFCLFLAAIPLVLWIVLGANRALSPVMGLCFALIMLPLAVWERDGRVRVARWLSFGGAASYAIYLVHNPVISLAARLTSWGGPWIILLACTLAGVAAGVVYHTWIERPLLSVAGRKTLTAKSAKQSAVARTES